MLRRQKINLSLQHKAKLEQDIKLLFQNNLTFKCIDLEDNGITHRHLQAMSDMLFKNNYVTEFVRMIASYSSNYCLFLLCDNVLNSYLEACFMSLVQC